MVLFLFGCVHAEGEDRKGFLSKNKSFSQTEQPNESSVIAALQSRRSILPQGSSYDQIADAVMSSSARVAQSELKAAQLRAEAAKYNWLPQIEPQFTLTTLSDFVTVLLVQTVLFDNGRKKAERNFAAQGVELAAVALSEDSNNRVHDGLTLYLAAEEARELAALSSRSAKDIEHFERVMEQRVEGGVSDRSDLDIIRQKLAEVRSEKQTAEGSRLAALVEIEAMTGKPMSDKTGVPSLPLPSSDETLSVLKAQVERDRAISRAKIERAAHLPGLGASASSIGGESNYGLTIEADNAFGIGTGSKLKAIEVTKESANRKVAEVQEDSNRSLATLRQRHASLTHELARSRALSKEAGHNLDLFQQQYKDGARQVLDVIGVYETWARHSKSAISLKYELARVELDVARDLGVLEDGQSL